MPVPPCVDVNLFAYNGRDTVGAAIDSVLAQSWRNLTLTLIDDGSTDGTLDILQGYVDRHPGIRLKRNRVNGGAVANFQRAFWGGDSDYVLPKSADDLIAPDFIGELMEQLLSHPNCVMCHAGGLVFTADRGVVGCYPETHRLSATESDPILRARHVMATYTSSPSFWGVYRRDAVDRLARIAYRAGWDHVLLAELALYGEIRHVPKPLYWRRDGGKQLVQLARASTEGAHRGADPDEVIADLRWCTPLITTSYAHIENFAIARLPMAMRTKLMEAVPELFRARWEICLRSEASGVRALLPQLLKSCDGLADDIAGWRIGRIMDVVRAIGTILPDEVFAGLDRLAAGRPTGRTMQSAAA